MKIDKSKYRTEWRFWLSNSNKFKSEKLNFIFILFTYTIIISKMSIMLWNLDWFIYFNLQNILILLISFIRNLKVFASILKRKK